MLDVSVVIPAYNRAWTIGRAVDSVLAQTLAPREVIVVDDGSSDATATIAETYAATDTRVRTIRQANAGAGAARNTGMAAASGAWIALLDSDDEWHPAKLEHAAALVDGEPAIELIHSNVEFVDDGVNLRSWDRQTVAEMTNPDYLMGSFFMRTSAVLFTRTLLEAVGGGFPQNRETCEDFELFWRLIATSPAIGYVPSRDVAVHVTLDGLTRTHAESKLMRDNIATMGDVLRWLRQRGGSATYTDILRARQYWELRKLVALWLRAGAWRSLVRDLRYGASELSGRDAMRALASASASMLRHTH